MHSLHIPFKNVVYEYPLSKAIEDGYTRTPFAVTRADVAFYNFGDEQLDKLMLGDGILCHETAKRKLAIYADKHGVTVVKPFMLVVCQNTDHASWVESYVKSKDFCDGKYENKTITIHSKLKGSESDFNTQMLLDVERNDNSVEIYELLEKKTEKIYREVVEKYIPIPRIKVTDEGVEEYNFFDFDMDFSEVSFMPISNDILIQNLEDLGDRERVKGKSIDFDGYDPHKILLGLLRKKSEIDYEKCSELLHKLIGQTCDYFENSYGVDGMKNVVMMYKKDIVQKIYTQMLRHFYITNGFLKEEVVGTRDYNFSQSFAVSKRIDLFTSYAGNIRSIVFEGIKRGVFREAQFDSRPELELVRILERDRAYVKNWLRPSSREFNITYNHGHNYEPDFVVEAEDRIFLVEVKGEDRIDKADVLAKKDRALKYCQVVSEWGWANGYKEWNYVFIPSKQVTENSTFDMLAKRFTVNEGTEVVDEWS